MISLGPKLIIMTEIIIIIITAQCNAKTLNIELFVKMEHVMKKLYIYIYIYIYMYTYTYIYIYIYIAVFGGHSSLRTPSSHYLRKFQ